MITPSIEEFKVARDNLNMSLFITSALDDAYRFNATQYYLAYANCKDPSVAAFWYKRMQNIHRAIWYMRASYRPAGEMKSDICQLLAGARHSALSTLKFSEEFNSPYQRVLRLFPEKDAHSHQYPELEEGSQPA